LGIETAKRDDERIDGNAEECLYSSAKNYASLGNMIEVEVITSCSRYTGQAVTNDLK
jgi:hypothetical protein